MDKYLRHKIIKRKFAEDIEPQEIFLDSLAHKKEEESGISEKKIEVSLSYRILQIFFGLIGATILVLFGKTFQLQVIEGNKFSALADGNKYTILSLQAVRGVIYDRNDQQLVFNKPSFDLTLDKKIFSAEGENKKNKTLEEISALLSMDIKELKKSIDGSKENKTLIAENINYDALIILEVKINAGEFLGFQIEKNYIREYKDGEIFSHLLGYTGKVQTEEFKTDSENYSLLDYIGRSGLEKSYEGVLRKDSGKLQIEKDALGNVLSQKVTKMPEPGNSLVLWLDEGLQRKIEENLSAVMKGLGVKKASAVAIDPQTGGILSLVSIPGFDNNLFSQGISSQDLKKITQNPLQPLFNRAVSGEYLTGSTIKPFIASAALQEKIISPEKQIYGEAYIEVPHQYDPEIVYRFADWKVHGWSDMRRAIAESVNIYFYTIGGGYKDQKGLGPARIKKYLELFGWGKETQVDLPEETEGFLPDPEWKEKIIKEPWFVGNTYHYSIGQGYLRVSPLQVANAFVAIANGGKLLKPKAVWKIIDSGKKVIQEMKPEVVRENFIDSANLQIVREGMRQAVSSPAGSSAILNSLPVEAAAKTGTAQTSKEGYYQNWVTVFAPYDNPKIVLTIVIENVQGMQAAALPVARGVLEWYFARD